MVRHALLTTASSQSGRLIVYRSQSYGLHGPGIEVIIVHGRIMNIAWLLAISCLHVWSNGPIELSPAILFCLIKCSI